MADGTGDARVARMRRSFELRDTMRMVAAIVVYYRSAAQRLAPASRPSLR